MSQDEQVRQAIITLTAILDDHLREQHQHLDRDALDTDLESLHQLRKQFDPRIKTEHAPPVEEESLH